MNNDVRTKSQRLHLVLHIYDVFDDAMPQAAGGCAGLDVVDEFQ